MRRVLVSLLVVAGIGGGAVAISGCGAEEAVGFDVAKAAAATSQQKTAKLTMSISVETSAIPIPIELKGAGVTSLTEPKGNVTFDVASLLSLAGQSGGSGALELRYDGGKLYVKPPKLDALPVPGGKPWVSVDAGQLATAAGLSSKGIGKLFTLDPAAQLRALKAAKGMKSVGKEQVGGVDTTHYSGTIAVSDFIAQLPAAQRAETQKALDKLEALSPGAKGSFAKPVPIDVWIDGNDVARRTTSSTTFPGQGSTPGGTIKQTYELSDFGAKLDVSPPPAGDIYDATKALTGALSSLGG